MILLFRRNRFVEKYKDKANDDDTGHLDWLYSAFMVA